MPGHKPLTIPWQGGLGNQLFELCAGLAVHARTGRVPCFTTAWLADPAPGETPRDFALEGLVLEREHCTESLPRGVRRLDVWSRRRVLERAPDDAPLRRLRPWTEVAQGYFQRLDVVEAAWPELLRRLSDSPFRTHRALTEPAATRGRGALHYRLGDYLTSAEARRVHGVTSPAYFTDVIGREHEQHGVRDWTVVSDQPEVALDLLKSAGIPRGVAVEVTGTHDEWSDLAALATGEVCVISNSSFSWWAGYIADRVSQARVVAPSSWFGNGDPEPAIFPLAWQRVPRTLLAGSAHESPSAG